MCVFVGVAGGSASGKTTLVERLIEQLGPSRAIAVAHDRYYRDQSALPEKDRHAVNYDEPGALDTALLLAHIEELRAGRSVALPVYDFTRHARRAAVDQVTPRPVVFIEGVLVLADARLRNAMDLRVFVKTADRVRFQRRLRRDVLDRGRTAESVRAQYEATVQPMHRHFVSPSCRWADVVVTGGGHNRYGLRRVLTEIRLRLNSKRG
jgi:uridine kinase